MAEIRQAAVAGIGQTEFSKESGRSELQLAAECIKAALDDAGLKPTDVDGLITFTLDNNDEIGVSRCLGIPNLTFVSRIPGGGAGAMATISQAAAVVGSGLCEVVVIWRAMNERSAYRFGQPQTPMSALQGIGGGSSFIEWCMPFGAQAPATWAALSIQRYMETYGVSNEDFGRVAVVQRKHAANNPAAWFYGKPITLAEHQASKWIVEPVLRLLDCCQESDGGVALVVTSLERARDLKQPAVRIVGATQSMPFNHEVITNYYHGNLSHMAEAEMTARLLYAKTGLGPKDIQAAMLYEAFSPFVLTQLEAFGFCKPGEAKDFIKDGQTEITGRLPVNTHGGLLGEAYIHGMNSAAEGVRQVRGSSCNQVGNIENVLVSSGFAAAILGRA